MSFFFFFFISFGFFFHSSFFILSFFFPKKKMAKPPSSSSSSREMFDDICEVAGTQLGCPGSRISSELVRCATGKSSIQSGEAVRFFDAVQTISRITREVYESATDVSAGSGGGGGQIQTVTEQHMSLDEQHEHASRMLIQANIAVRKHGEMIRSAPPGMVKTLDDRLFSRSVSDTIQPFVAAFAASIVKDEEMIGTVNEWMQSSDPCAHLRDDANVMIACGESQLRILSKEGATIKVQCTKKPALVHILTRLMTDAIMLQDPDLQSTLLDVISLLPNSRSVLSMIFLHLRGNWHDTLSPREDAQRDAGPDGNNVIHAMVVSVVRTIRVGLVRAIKDMEDRADCQKDGDGIDLYVPEEDNAVFEALCRALRKGLFEYSDGIDETHEDMHVKLFALSILHVLFNVHLRKEQGAGANFTFSAILAKSSRYRC